MKLLQIYIFLFILSNFLQARTNDPIIKFDTDLNAWMIEGTSTTIPILTFHQEMISALIMSYFIVDEVLSHPYLEEIVRRLHQKGTRIVIGGREQVNLAETIIEYRENLFKTWQNRNCYLISSKKNINCGCNRVHTLSTEKRMYDDKKRVIGTYTTNSAIADLLDDHHYSYPIHYNATAIILRSEMFDETAFRQYATNDEVCSLSVVVFLSNLIHELAHAIHDVIYPFWDDYGRPFDPDEWPEDHDSLFQYVLYHTYEETYAQMVPIFTKHNVSLIYALKNMYEFFAEGVAMYFTAIDLYEIGNKIEGRDWLNKMLPYLHDIIERIFGERPNEDVVEKAKQKTIDFINRFYNGDVLITPRF